MLRSYVRNVMTGRLLAIAAIVAVAGLWPTPAAAGITCKSEHYLICSPYECCFFNCVVCRDAEGNDVGDSCDAGTCYSKQY